MNSQEKPPFLTFAPADGCQLRRLLSLRSWPEDIHRTVSSVQPCRRHVPVSLGWGWPHGFYMVVVYGKILCVFLGNRRFCEPNYLVFPSFKWAALNNWKWRVDGVCVVLTWSSWCFLRASIFRVKPAVSSITCVMRPSNSAKLKLGTDKKVGQVIKWVNIIWDMMILVVSNMEWIFTPLVGDDFPWKSSTNCCIHFYW